LCALDIMDSYAYGEGSKKDDKKRFFNHCFDLLTSSDLLILILA
jgi:predicted GTPase